MMYRLQSWMLTVCLLFGAPAATRAGWFGGSNDDFIVGAVAFDVTIPPDHVIVRARALASVTYANWRWAGQIVPEEYVVITERNYEIRRGTVTPAADGRQHVVFMGQSRLSLAEENPNTALGGKLRKVDFDVEFVVLRPTGTYVTVSLPFFQGWKRQEAIDEAHRRRFEKLVVDAYDGLLLTLTNHEIGLGTLRNEKNERYCYANFRRHDTFVDTTDREAVREKLFDDAQDGRPHR